MQLHIPGLCRRVCSDFSRWCAEGLQRLLELLDFTLSLSSFPMIELNQDILKKECWLVKCQLSFLMCQPRNITAVDQCVGTDSDWCQIGRKIMLDKEYMVLPTSSITAQGVIAEFVGHILGGGRKEETSVQQKPKV